MTTNKARITRLESKVVINEPPKKNPNISDEKFERCINSLAAALHCTRADVDEYFKELTNDNK